jgi:Cytochrome P450
VSRAKNVAFGPSHGITLVMFLLTLSATANMPVVSFWALYHLNRSKKECADVIQDYRRVANAAKAEDGRMFFNRHDYHDLKMMDNTVKECVRMHQGVIHLGNVLRGIHKDQLVHGFLLEKGSILCLPTHQYFNEQWYKNPHQFNPDRWNDAKWVESLPRFTFSPFGVCAPQLFSFVFCVFFYVCVFLVCVCVCSVDVLYVCLFVCYILVCMCTCVTNTSTQRTHSSLSV